MLCFQEGFFLKKSVCLSRKKLFFFQIKSLLTDEQMWDFCVLTCPILIGIFPSHFAHKAQTIFPR